MDFPHHHHHHGRRDDDDDRRRAPPPPYAADPYARPPPPAYGRDDPDPYSRPPPPAFGRVDDDPYARPPPPAYGHAGGEGYGRHPPPAYGREDDYGGRAPPPAYGAGGYGGGGSEYGNVQHVGHEVCEDRPHHGGGGAYGGGDAPPARQQTVRVFCKAGEDYSLAVRHGKVCLARTDRNDEAQHWIKDMKHSTRVKDEEGYPCFSLVNKATGEALKHSLGQSHPVRLASYDPNYLDESVLWTESRDVGEGFRCIRMVNNIYLNFDAFHGDKDHGGVRDGTILVLWEWCEGDNQRWKIVPWCW